MGDLSPFTSTFTTVGLLVSAGTKITRAILNQVAENTAFNWLGGRHPMRESFGITTVALSDGSRTLSQGELDIIENTEVAYGEANDVGLVPAVDIEVAISARDQGIIQFSTGDSYEVFLTLVTAIGPDYIINEGNQTFNTIFSIDKDFFNLYSLFVVSQDPNNFVIRFDMPQPHIPGGGLRLYEIAWFAKGW